MVAGVPNASAIQLDTSDVTKLEECVAKVHRRTLPIAFLIGHSWDHLRIVLKYFCICWLNLMFACLECSSRACLTGS